jgi:hypothetical protein
MNLYDGGNQPMIGLFFEAIDFIESAISKGGKVYVHCVQGISRSSSFVLSYLIWKEKTGFKKLLENLKTIRPVSSPNPGFLVQLMKWEEYLTKKGTLLFRIAPLNSYYGRSHFQVGPLLCENTTFLDSRTCFILINQELKIFLWIGSKTKEFLSTKSKYFIGTILNGLGLKDYETIHENSETKEFQISLLQLNVNFLKEQKDPYPELILLENAIKEEVKTEIPIAKVKAKLFNFDDEYFDDYGTFEKEDLNSDGIFILSIDDLKIIYVWKGIDSEYEDDPMELGKLFLKDKKRDEFYMIKIVNEGDEPNEFWNYFD